MESPGRFFLKNREFYIVLYNILVIIIFTMAVSSMSGRLRCRTFIHGYTQSRLELFDLRRIFEIKNLAKIFSHSWELDKFVQMNL